MIDRDDEICGGTGDHEGQDHHCCDECCSEWDKGGREAGFCAVHDEHWIDRERMHFSAMDAGYE